MHPTATAWAFMEADADVVGLEGPRGEGKGSPDDTPTLTPSGWVKIGDLAAGDAVMAGDGTVTQVTGVYPRGVLPAWRVACSDGTSLVVSDDHCWAIETAWDRAGRRRSRPSRARPETRSLLPRHVRQPRTGWRVVTTATIRAQLVAGAWRLGGRWAIPLVGAVEFPAHAVPLDPYRLGVLLGDGCLRGEQVTLFSADAEIVAAVRAVLPPG